MTDILADGLSRLGFTGENHERIRNVMDSYIHELQIFNAAYDLIGADARDDIIIRHIFDSLAAVSVLKPFIQRISDQNNVVHIGDIGSGGGLPGIPLAAAFPDADFILLERMSKRCTFLENCVAVLGLHNIHVINNQAEHFSKRTLDIAVFRAFRPLDRKMTKLLLSLIKKGGVLAAYKAKKERIIEEMDGIKDLVPAYTVESLTVPYLTDHERHLVLITNN